MISHKIPTWAKIAVLIGVAAVALAGAHYYLNILSKPQEEELKKTYSDTDGDKLLDGYNLTLEKDSPTAKKLLDLGIVHKENGNKITFYGEMSLESDPLKPNPSLSYALEKGISADVAKKLIPLDEDGRMDENEKSLVDYLYNLSHLALPEEAKALQAKAVDKILADGKVSSDEAKALTYLSTYSGEINKDYINLGLDGDVIKYLLFTSSLKDQDFARYAIANKLCIQDHKLTDLEINFLKDPEKYGKDLLNSYIAEAESSVMYSDLGKELRKIPEIKAAFNKSDVKTIESVEDIVYSILMSKNPELVRKNLDMMLKEGIPEKRKYCTPLQALEWYYVDNEPEKDNLLEYRQLNLERFIMRVWRTTSTSENFTSDRWKNFDEVTDRLNSPDLVSIYMMNNFKYKTDIEVYGAVNYWASAMEMFKIKAGDCEDHAVFATYCLAKNGYPAQGLCIIWEGPGFRGHMTCVYKYPGNPLIYCIDVKGTKHGPFDTYHDVAKFMYMKYPKIGPLESYQPYDIDLLSGKFKPK